MIEPQMHNGQRGVIGPQHGLQKLTETLDALTKGQQAQQQRDTQMQELLTDLMRQCATQAQHLTRLQTWHQRVALTIAGLAVLTLAFGGLVGWQLTHKPEQGYARALGAIDASLAQQWSTLPKGAQEALSATYARMGLPPPGG